MPPWVCAYLYKHACTHVYSSMHMFPSTHTQGLQSCCVCLGNVSKGASAGPSWRGPRLSSPWTSQYPTPRPWRVGRQDLWLGTTNRLWQWWQDIIPECKRLYKTPYQEATLLWADSLLESLLLALNKQADKNPTAARKPEGEPSPSQHMTADLWHPKWDLLPHYCYINSYLLCFMVSWPTETVRK